MRGRRARRAERTALVARAQDLPPEELGGFTAVMLGSASVGLLLEVPALVVGVRAAAYAWRRRGDGFREVVGSGPVTRALVLVAAVLLWRRLTSALMVRSLRRRVERGDTDGTPRARP